MSQKFEKLFTHNPEPISDEDIATVTSALMPHLLDTHSAEFDARALLVSKLLSRVHLEKERADRRTWRCYHCDEVFTSRLDAANHFGRSEGDTPGCLLSKAEGGLLGVVRQQAEELHMYRGEDTELMRQLYAAGVDAERRYREGEEKGYAKGLGDHAKAMQQIWQLAIQCTTIYGQSAVSAWKCTLCEQATSGEKKDVAHLAWCPIKGYEA